MLGFVHVIEYWYDPDEVPRDPPAPPFDVDPKPNPTTVIWSGHQRIHLRYVNGHWVSPELLSLELSGRYRPHVHQPRVGSPSVNVDPPSSARSAFSTDGRS